jgi:hypothetical protein
MFAFTGRNRFIQWKASRDTLKFKNHPQRFFMHASISFYQKLLNLSGDPVPLSVHEEYNKYRVVCLSENRLRIHGEYAESI